MLIINPMEKYIEKFFKLPIDEGDLKDVELKLRYIGLTDQQESQSKWIKTIRGTTTQESIDFTAFSSEMTKIASMSVSGWKNIMSTDGAEVPFTEANKKKVIDAIFPIQLGTIDGGSPYLKVNTIQSWIYATCTDFKNFINDTVNL